MEVFCFSFKKKIHHLKEFLIILISACCVIDFFDDFTKLLRKAPHFAERGSSLNVYFSAENLLTLTKYSGMAPEVGGYDTLTYPVHKVFAFGLKLNY